MTNRTGARMHDIGLSSTGTDNHAMRDRMAMGTGNALKIGLFGSNCSSGRAVTKVPERWSGNWEDNLALARLADEAGIEFMLPVGRWKGYGGDTDYMGTTLETITWATGLLAKTGRLVVFGTVHAPLFHPLIAAKQMVTADWISGGRFGLNIVVGWNEDEFQMFGVTQREHDARYDYAQEWTDAVKTAWTQPDDVDFDGQFIKLKAIRARPKPHGGTRPLIMNAGISPVGRAFAIRNCDAFFTQASRTSMEDNARNVQDAKAEARKHGRELDVYTVGVVTCRRTRKEAEEYYRYAMMENGDWSAVDGILRKRNISPATVGQAEFERERQGYVNGMGGLLMVGDPDEVAQTLADLSRAGVRGIGFSFVNYLKELPFFCGEVLPRLERLGIREKRR
jgi:alkanesulfonate monooxygenase SsuD/methylene tetrahydromethanopterin reductase-like flavin-dependent oxidoreductase (luciferase family)